VRIEDRVAILLDERERLGRPIVFAELIAGATAHIVGPDEDQPEDGRHRMLCGTETWMLGQQLAFAGVIDLGRLCQRCDRYFAHHRRLLRADNVDAVQSNASRVIATMQRLKYNEARIREVVAGNVMQPVPATAKAFAAAGCITIGDQVDTYHAFPPEPANGRRTCYCGTLSVLSETDTSHQ
jgi:hypothetical protein